MKKIIASVLFLSLTAAHCAAAGFDLNVGSPALMIKASGFSVAPISLPKAEKSVKSSLVQVSGYLTLNGNAWMPQNGGYTSVSLSGWVTFRDSAGKVYSNNTYVTANTGVWLRPNQHVSQSVNPSVTVQLYRDGRPVGSATLNGYINVSGWPGSSGMVMLNGSGQLSGSVFVQDEE